MLGHMEALRCPTRSQKNVMCLQKLSKTSQYLIRLEWSLKVPYCQKIESYFSFQAPLLSNSLLDFDHENL